MLCNKTDSGICPCWKSQLNRLKAIFFVVQQGGTKNYFTSVTIKVSATAIMLN